MVKINYEKITTDKFICKKCGNRKMCPNKVWCKVDWDYKIKGYKCLMCGAVNYPVRDAKKIAENTFARRLLYRRGDNQK